MALFREEDRLKEDWRILKISDPRDFALFPRAEALEFTGMVYSHPLSPTLKEDVDAFICPRSLEYDVEFNAGSGWLSKVFNLYRSGIPRLFWPVAIDLSVLNELAFPDHNTTGLYLRFNSEYPQYQDEPNHMHDSTMTYAAKGHSTLLQNEEGGFYKLPDNTVALIGDYQRHIAPDLPENVFASGGPVHRINFVFF
jgi:hypothetical protein